MNNASPQPATKVAQDRRADYVMPTLSLLFTQSTAASAGLPGDGGSLAASNID